MLTATTSAGVNRWDEISSLPGSTYPPMAKIASGASFPVGKHSTDSIACANRINRAAHSHGRSEERSSDERPNQGPRAGLEIHRGSHAGSRQRR
jgi:hypothetical protein